MAGALDFGLGLGNNGRVGLISLMRNIMNMNNRIIWMAAALFAASVSAASAQVARVVRPGALSGKVQVAGETLTATFALPISPESSWPWNLADSKPGKMEYAWKVGFELGPDVYEVGITCFKPKLKAPPAGGTLRELLARCQKDVWRSNPDGTAETVGRQAPILAEVGGVDGRQRSMKLVFTDKDRVARIRREGLHRASLIWLDHESHYEISEQVEIDYLP